MGIIAVKNGEVKCLHTLGCEPVLRPVGSPTGHQLSRGFRDLIDGSSVMQYRIEMFAAAAKEGVVREQLPLDLTDRRLQLERYRSRWDHFDQVTEATFAIPPFRIQICEKGYIAYAFRNDSNAMLCAHIIRLPSTHNGVAPGEWTIDLDTLSPKDSVLGMTLQPDANLLVLVTSPRENA